MSRNLTVSAVLLGATSLLVQIVVARELLTSFLGNEISLALVLVAWLLLVGVGSAGGGRLLARPGRARAAVPWLSTLTAAALLPTVWVAQAAGGAGRLPGEVVGPGTMLLYAGAGLALPCCLLGLQFAALARVAEEQTGGAGAAAIYTWEAAGAVIGGLFFHFLLADHAGSSQSVLLAAAANVASAGGWWWEGGRRPAAVMGALAAVAALAAALLNPGGQFGLDAPGLARRWRGLEVVAEANSRYGNVAVTRDGKQLTFYESGLPAFTTQAAQTDEVAVGTPLLIHPDPGRLLMISGGLGGALREALKQPLQSVDYVESDPKVVSLARRLLPPELQAALADPRVHLHTGDGRAYVKRCGARYDVILLLAPDPSTAALSRFYTREFFLELRRLLNPGGLVCLGLSAAQAELSGPRLGLHATVYAALRSVFPNVLVIPGDCTQYLAALSTGALGADPGVLAARTRARGLRPAFANEAWFRSALDSLPREMALRSLASASGTPPNTDERPVSCHYWLQLWLEGLSPRAMAWPERLTRALRLAWLLLPVAALAGLIWRRNRRLPEVGAGAAVGAAGLVQMGAQLALVLAYQAVAGYLYHQIGVLVALFMLGLAMGSAASRRTFARASVRTCAGWLAGALGLQAASALGIPLLLRTSALGPAWAGAVFGAAAVWLGVLGGLAFPLAVAVTSARVGAARATARLYALDLAGAALGALAIGALAIPAAGIRTSCLLLGVISVAGALPLLGLAAARREVLPPTSPNSACRNTANGGRA